FGRGIVHTGGGATVELDRVTQASEAQRIGGISERDRALGGTGRGQPACRGGQAFSERRLHGKARVGALQEGGRCAVCQGGRAAAIGANELIGVGPIREGIHAVLVPSQEGLHLIGRRSA